MLPLMMIFLAIMHSLNFNNNKKKKTGNTKTNGKQNDGIMVTSKYLSNFERAIEMQLVNCKINLSLQIVFYLMLKIKQQYLQ